MQFSSRQNSHPSSAFYASHNGKTVKHPTLNVGDVVFVKSDRSKSRARQPFFVLSIDTIKQLATVQKFPMTNFRRHPIQLHFQNLYKCTPDLNTVAFPEKASNSPVHNKEKKVRTSCLISPNTPLTQIRQFFLLIITLRQF